MQKYQSRLLQGVGVPVLALANLLLPGCASFSQDNGFAAVKQLTHERIGQLPSYQPHVEASDAASTRVDELLQQPLTADTAVEIALLNNKELQSSYADLGIAEADLVRAGRLANPSFTFGKLSGNGSVEIDRAVIFNVLGLLTMPMAKQIEQHRFEQAQLQAAYESVGAAVEARKAFFEAVAAQQLVGYHGQVKIAAEAANELAQRMLLAGNFNKLAQMREQSFYSDAITTLAKAQHQAVAAKEKLGRALGLTGNQLDTVKLPERLPDLPPAPAEAQHAEQTAMNKRLDVLMAKRATHAAARSLGLSQATRFVNVLHVGYQNKSASGEALSHGYEIELELPLFDFGSTRVARAEAIYMQSVNRTTAIAIKAQSEVRESFSSYRTAYDVARHFRDEVVPLRQRISEENLLRYNGMLASVFDLLSDSKEQIASVVGAIEALRDHWIAETDLQTAITGRSPTGSRGLNSAKAASSSPASGH